MIGFIVPTHIEASTLLDALTNPEQLKLRGRKATRGFIGNTECVVLICGIGKVVSAAATQQLIDMTACSTIIHFGCAGALSKDLKIGDFILGQEIIEHDHYSFFGKKSGVVKAHSDEKLAKKMLAYATATNQKLQNGPIVSGTEDIVTTKRRDELFAKHAGLSVDWESYAVAKVCNICDVPCVVLRAISDYAYENTSEEFKKNFRLVAADLCRFVIGFLNTEA